MTAHTHRAQFAHDGSRMKLCHCCGSMLHPLDFRPDYFPAKANYCEGYFNGPVCTSCMDEWEPPALPPCDGFNGYTIGGA